MYLFSVGFGILLGSLVRMRRSGTWQLSCSFYTCLKNMGWGGGCKWGGIYGGI